MVEMKTLQKGLKWKVAFILSTLSHRSFLQLLTVFSLVSQEFLCTYP